MDIGVSLTTFVLIFPAELPDKTFVATLVLATRYRPLQVWVGVSAAFAVQVAVAVTAGGLLALLPDRVVSLGTALLFTVGSILLFRSARTAGADEADGEAKFTGLVSGRATDRDQGWRPVAISFAVLFAAEWGDLSQLLTAGLAARYADPLSVFLGSWVALATVAAIGVLAGRTLLSHVEPSLVKRVAAVLFAVLAILTWLRVLGVQPPL